MVSRMMMVLMGLAMAAPADAQIADRIEDRGRAGRASGAAAYTRGAAACARYDWNGTHVWFDFGWGTAGWRVEHRDAWYDDDGHRDWRSLERERERCADWGRARSGYSTGFERAHANVHEHLTRAHFDWHRRHDGRPHKGWWRSHESLHERLARDHDRWHRNALRDRERDYGRRGPGWGAGSH